MSNALLVGEIFGQLVVGLICDYLGRKVAIVTTTMMIVIGGILATAAHGTTINGMFWMLTICRGIVGFGTGGKIYSRIPQNAIWLTDQANILPRPLPLLKQQTNIPCLNEVLYSFS